MLLDDLYEETEGEEFVDSLNNPEEAPNTTKTEEQAEISLHAMQGTTGFQTMRIWGEVGNFKVIMLIDSGSTHNFISTGVAKAMKLSFCQRYQIGVIIANGERVRTLGTCKQLRWSMQGHEFTADFMILPVNGYDMVLGIQWLAKLGLILWDFGALTMQIQCGEE